MTIVGGQDVAELTSTADRDRVSGVRVIDRDSGAQQELTADLVVDAMGRAAHTPAFLESRGYGRPGQNHIVMHTTYVSQQLRIPPGTLKEMLVIISPAAGRPKGLLLVGNENDTWIFTVFGMVGHEPARDLAGMLSFAQGYTPAHLLAALRAGEPTGPLVQHRMPCSQWRRYDKVIGLVDPPARLLNPLFLCRVAAVNLRRRRRDSQPAQVGVADDPTPLPDMVSK